LYGYRAEQGTGMEVVAVRLIGRTPSVDIDDVRYDDMHHGGEKQTDTGCRLANFGPPWGQMDTPITSREALRGGATGPLLVDEYDSTIVIPPDWLATTDHTGNIVLEINDATS
jgi:N-methylhydantoinase A